MNSLGGKSILLTGATGFVALHLADRLRNIPGARLILLARKPIETTGPHDIVVNRSLNGLTRQVWLEQGIERIDVVFHLGAYIPKNTSECDAISEIYCDNLLGTRALLESLPNTPEKIVFSSTADVYAPPSDESPLTEESALGPATLYGASKLFCEQLIRVYARKNSCGYAILRYGHVYGPGEGAYAKLIPQTIRALLRNESPIIYGDGRVQRDFIYVCDVAEATVRAATSTRKSIEPINVVGGQSISVKELVELLARRMGFAGEIHHSREDHESRSLCFNNARMLDILGEWKLLPLEEGLDLEINYFRGLSDGRACES